jgi:hypothetical protein
MNKVVDIQKLENHDIEYAYFIFKTYFDNKTNFKNLKIYYSTYKSNFIDSVLMNNKIIGIEANNKEEASILSLALMIIIDNHCHELIFMYNEALIDNKDNITIEKIFKEQLLYKDEFEEFNKIQKPIKNKIKYNYDNNSFKINCQDGIILNKDIILKLLQTKLEEKLSKRIKQIFDFCE